jgi:hypothetical protein
MLHEIDFRPPARRALIAGAKKQFRRDVIEGIGGQMVAAWGLHLPGIRGRFDEFLITGCTLTGQQDVTKHRENATHEFLMFRVHPEKPIDFTESLFVQRASVLRPAFAGMQVPAGTAEDFLRCVGKRIDWVMAAPITCTYDLVEPFCAGSKRDPDVFDLYGYLDDDDRTLVA